MGLRRRNIPALLAAVSLAVSIAVPAVANRIEAPANDAPAGAPPSRITNELPTGKPVAAPPPSRLNRNEKLVRTALSFRGYPYRFGGTGRSGFDCSGFMKYLYGKEKGVGLPRTAAQQFRSGKKVSRKDLQPGDLLFFRSRGRYVGHVGMYAGKDMMVHAANPRRGVTVDRVFGGYWGKRLVGIRRPTG